jgi:asparagine synthase (glutamine-hydrolysing)
VSEGVARQLESDVKLGAQLSGGIDSSLVVAAAQERLGSLSTFSVQFADPHYDETWAATAVARHVNSRHEVLQMGPGHGDWNHVVSLLQAAGQPYRDTSLFAANEVSALMRQRVTVALSGDGGDEAFGGYAPFTHLNRIARFRRLPSLVGRGAVAGARGLARFGALGPRVPDHLQSLVSGRDAGIVQHLMCWVRQPEQHRLLPELDVLPVSRHFEPMWQLHSSPELTPVDRLSARFTEAKTRLALPNDYLFKVDLASMRHGLEIRVPLLDEQLFEYALRLPHRLKASGREGKLVLRSVAARRLPRAVARKAKHGFGVPVDSWMADAARDAAADRAASQQRRDRGSTARCMHRSRSPSAERRDSPGISREGLHQRVMMLLSVELSLQASRRRTGAQIAGGP